MQRFIATGQGSEEDWFSFYPKELQAQFHWYWARFLQSSVNGYPSPRSRLGCRFVGKSRHPSLCIHSVTAWNFVPDLNLNFPRETIPLRHWRTRRNCRSGAGGSIPSFYLLLPRSFWPLSSEPESWSPTWRLCWRRARPSRGYRRPCQRCSAHSRTYHEWLYRQELYRFPKK